ncbi:MAG: PBSX family phage terminase large subunit [Clostridia bacterium]|nr:PBSX family phage terminase large subunit [Clostridia bacterium]
MKRIYLPEIIGKGYGEFWHFKGRYRVVKGSRASKKSKTAALWFIYNMMKYEKSNLLVVRKTYRTLKNSCFEELKWAIETLGVKSYWLLRQSPMEMVYIPTGQKIYFRGLDDPMKVTSITVSAGSLCWLWIEEAYEISDEKSFDMLDESIRGETGDGLFKQVTITFNPWNEKHWLKKRFFDKKDENTLAITTNYMCNEFLDEADRALFEAMRLKNPERYRVAGLGEWGRSEGVIYTKWREENFSVKALLSENGNLKSVFGLDFGYVNDPTALFCALVDNKEKKIYVFDEMYEKNLSNEEIYERIASMGYAKERIRADSAEIKSIDRLRSLGLTRIRRAKKGADSIRYGIALIQEYEIIVHPLCVNFITEISNYAWETDNSGKRINRAKDEFNHLMDAMRYAMENEGEEEGFSFK